MAVFDDNNRYLNYENAKEVYEKVVTHGPIDIKVMLGNSHPHFQSEDTQAYGKAAGYFKTTRFCEGIKMFLGAQELISGTFAASADERFFFDKCEVQFVEGIWFNVWSMSIERQLEIMGSKAFESGINKVDPIFQMRDFRIMYDYRTSDVNGAGSV